MKDGRLEVSDLMAGDWVRSKKWTEKPFKLTSLNANGRYYYGITSNGGLIGPFLIEELEPIPLTKEILEKNGFKVTEDGCTSWRLDIGSTLIKINGTHDYHLSINIPTNTSAHGFRWLLYDLTIFYVHQLQQAMRIFRIDKKIEL